MIRQEGAFPAAISWVRVETLSAKQDVSDVPAFVLCDAISGVKQLYF